MKGRVLTALMLVAAGVTARAQWVQTAGPQGGVVAEIVSDDSHIIAYVQQDLYSLNDGKWTLTGSLEGKGGLYNMFGGETMLLVDGVMMAQTREGIYRSIDYGVTWSEAAVEGAIVTDGKNFYAVEENMLRKSTDGGASWSSGIPYPELAGAPVFFGGSIYAVQGYSSQLIRSVDNGATWSDVQTDLPQTGMGGRTLVAGDDALYIASAGLFKSTDGERWEAIPHQFSEWVTYSDIVLDGATLWVNTNYGIHRMTDGVWEKIDAPFAPELEPTKKGMMIGTYAGVFNVGPEATKASAVNAGLIRGNVWPLAAIGDLLLANTPGGLFRSPDAGKNWEYVNEINPYAFVQHGTSVFAIAGVLYRSTDDGATWEMAGPRYDFEIEDDPGFMGDVTSVVSVGDVLFAGVASRNNMEGGNSWANGGVFRSDDNGDSWVPVVEGLPVDCFNYAPVSALVATENAVIAATAAGVYRTTDGGASWVASMNGLPIRDYYNENGTVFRLGGTVYYHHNINGFFQSIDEGMNWTPMNPSMPAGYTISGTSIAADRLYLVAYKDDGTRTTEQRLFVFDGSTWKDITGTQPEGVLFQAFAESNGKLYAGSQNHGVWTVGADELPASSVSAVRTTDYRFSLAGYPNPTTGDATVEISLTERARVTMTLVSTMGETIAVIEDGVVEAGNHLRRVDGTGLPAGAYLVRATIDGMTREIPFVKID